MVENSKSQSAKKTWRNKLHATTTFPKYILQSALFPASFHQKNDHKKEQRFTTHEGREFSSTNSGFSQFDLAVTLAQKKLFSSQRSIEVITSSLSDITHILNRADGGKTRRLIIDSLQRLANSTYCLAMENQVAFDGYKIEKMREPLLNQVEITWSQKYLANIYNDQDICHINIDTYLALNLGIQTWLYGFFCTEPDLSSIDLDTLHQLSGSHYHSLSDFKKAVKEALYVLEKHNIIGWRHGVTREGIVFWESKDLL